jgi:hypothetical protein
MTLKQSTTLVLLYVACLLLIVGCKHPKDKLAFIGPEYAPAPDGFYVVNNSITPEYASVDLSKNNQFFNASFSSNVQWYLVITGLQSGAQKNITGISSAIGQSLTSWDGASDNTIFFQKGETCQVALNFLGSKLQVTNNFVILEEKNETGLLIDDFEDGPDDSTPLDSIFQETQDTGIIVNRKDSSVKVQGKYSLFLQGDDANSDYLIAGVINRKSLLNKISFASADSLMISLFIYGKGDSTSSLEIKIMEDDDASGSYDAAKDDAYHTIVSAGWQGWQSLSYAYDALTNTAADGIGNGNNVKEPKHIIKISLSLIVIPAGKKATLNVDYVSLSRKK